MTSVSHHINQRALRVNFLRTAQILSQLLAVVALAAWWSGYTGVNSHIFFALVCCIAARTVLTRHASALEYVTYIYLIYLFVIPGIGFYALGNGDPLPYIALVVLFSDALVALGNRFDAMTIFRIYKANARLIIRKDKSLVLFGAVWIILMLLAALGGLIVDNASIIGMFSFVGPYSLSLLAFERIISSISSFRVYIMIASYIFLVGIYIVLYWSGFGRLLIGAYVLMPILICSAYRDIGLRPWHAAVAAPVALAVSHYSRYGIEASIEDLAGGSASHHLQLTMELDGSNAHLFYGGSDAFFDQYSLFFLNWFPRELWSTKPIGLGFLSVDNWFGRQGYDEGFSVSVGMIGEQIYLIGEYYVLGVLILLITILLTRIFLLRMSRQYIAPLVAFDVSLISYVWGGCATFGSRAWFFAIPMLVAIYFIPMFRDPPRRVGGRHLEPYLQASGKHR